MPKYPSRRTTKRKVDNQTVYGTIMSPASNDPAIHDILAPDHPLTLVRIVGHMMIKTTASVDNGIIFIIADIGSQRNVQTFLAANPLAATSEYMQQRLSDQVIWSCAFALPTVSFIQSIPVDVKAMRKLESGDLITIYVMTDGTVQNNTGCVYALKVFWKET